MNLTPCPNWTKPGDPVSGRWKQDLLRELGQRFGLRHLVETGTCQGSTVLALQHDFAEIHTIELSPYYAEDSRLRLAGVPNVRLYEGDSRVLLPEMLAAIPPGPVLFWLDAHSSGGKTADAGDPLPEEIRLITQLRPESLVVVDDMLDCELRHVEEAGVSLDGWTRSYFTGEVIMHRGGYAP